MHADLSCKREKVLHDIVISLLASSVIVAVGYYSKLLVIPLILIFGLDGSNNIPDRYFNLIYYGTMALYMFLSSGLVFLVLRCTRRDSGT